MTSSHRSASLPRVPLVSDEILRQHNVFFEVDTRFRRAARLLQCLWLKDRNIEPGIHVRGEGSDAVIMPLHSNLSREAARAGKNFLSPTIHAFTRRQLVLREEGAAIDEERLFGNGLSSMPLCFNMFAPLAMDLELASEVFRRLLPDFVKDVDGFCFEHSPGRREERFLHDGTAWDVAVQVITPDGEPATLFIEVKYSEDMTGPAARLRERYDAVSRESGLFVDPDNPALRSLGLEQLWREHMLAQLTVDQGITPRAMFLAIGPRLNRRVQVAFRVFENELIAADDRDDNRVPFKALTLEAVFEAIGEAGDKELSRELWQRYADFERIFHMALGEFIDAPPAQVTTKPKDKIAAPQKTRKQISKSQAAESADNPAVDPMEVAR